MTGNRARKGKEPAEASAGLEAGDDGVATSLISKG